MAVGDEFEGDHPLIFMHARASVKELYSCYL